MVDGRDERGKYGEKVAGRPLVMDTNRYSEGGGKGKGMLQYINTPGRREWIGLSRRGGFRGGIKEKSDGWVCGCDI